MALDKRVAGTLEQQFLDDLGFSEEIHLEEFRKRGRWERIKESACYSVWRVL
jgi:hypothetical protein